VRGGLEATLPWPEGDPSPIAVAHAALSLSLPHFALPLSRGLTHVRAIMGPPLLPRPPLTPQAAGGQQQQQQQQQERQQQNGEASQGAEGQEERIDCSCGYFSYDLDADGGCGWRAFVGA